MPSCHVTYGTKRPRPQEVVGYFLGNSRIKQDLSSFALAHTVSIFSAYARKISKVTGKLQSPSLLEVGCGSARTLHYLEGHFDNSTCYALDISPEAVRLVNQLSPSYFTSVASAFNLPLPDKYFDVSFSIGLVEHFTRVQAAQIMMEKIRVTRLDGWVCVMVPWASSVYNLIVRRAFGKYWPFGDEDPFHRAELADFMKEIGLCDASVSVIYGTTLLGIGRRPGG